MRSKFKPSLAIIRIYFFVCFTTVLNAQTNTGLPLKKDVNNLSKHIAKAIDKSYRAAVLMWEIDAESGARMSAQFSGVVVSKDGVILSAAHVVMPDKTYKVMFPDGQECVAKGRGRITIPPTFMLPDAAMLKITGNGPWPFAEMGWSSSLKVNTPCISIAYPETQEQRKPMVRFGRITLLKNKYGFLQSSCIMEPGDSGGPLFDILGRVIGLHSGVEVSEEVNYEVPIDTYRKFWNSLTKAVNYASLPPDSVTVSTDPLLATLNSVSFKEPLIPGRLNLTRSSVKISSVVDGRNQQIVATVFSTYGLKVKPAYQNKSILLSKSSMVGEEPIVTIQGGKKIKARIIARGRANDLVLLLTDNIKEKGLSLNLPQTDSIGFECLGTFLISPRADSTPRIGVLGSLLLNLPPITSYGYIGATTNIKNNKLVFTFIQPGSAAQQSGLQTGDIIQTVGGKEVEDQLDFLKALQKYGAGDTILIKIFKDGKEQTKPVVLKYPPQKVATHPADLFVGGKSTRRDGFSKVFLHDSALKAIECGGPVFDANGKLLGINIARLSRTSTVAIPAYAVKKFILSNL